MAIGSQPPAVSGCLPQRHAAADRGRCRHRQDQDVGGQGGPVARSRSPAGPAAAVDLHEASRGGDDRAGRVGLSRSFGQSDLGWHLPLDRQSAAPSLRVGRRAGGRLHRARPRRQRRAVGAGQNRGRVRPAGQAVPQGRNHRLDLLQDGQQPGQAERHPPGRFPVVCGPCRRSAHHLRRLYRQQAGQPCCRLRRPAPVLAGPDGQPGRRGPALPVRPCADRRVPGHQHHPGRDHPGDVRPRHRGLRRRRRRPGHLRVPGRHRGQHVDLPNELRRRRGGDPRAELPLDDADTRRGECGAGPGHRQGAHGSECRCGGPRPGRGR